MPETFQQGPQQQQLDPMSQAVEREVRMLIGDLHMQIIVLRCLRQVQQQQQEEAAPAKPNGSRPTVVQP